MPSKPGGGGVRVDDKFGELEPDRERRVMLPSRFVMVELNTCMRVE